MKAFITINFKKIKGVSVDDYLLRQEPSLVRITGEVITKLCTAFEEHFKAKGIQVEVFSEIQK